jgi:hypothetical protein
MNASVYERTYRMCSIDHVREYCMRNLGARTDMLAVTHLQNGDNLEIVWCDGGSFNLQCSNIEQLTEEEFCPLLEETPSVWYPPNWRPPSKESALGFDWSVEGF